MRIRVVVDGWTLLALVVASFSSRAVAQVPSRTSEPRLAVPRAEVPVAQPPGQPTTGPAATGQTASAPTDTTNQGAPIGGVVQAVGTSSGVTQLGGGAAQQTSSTSYAASARTYTGGRFSLLVEKTPVGFVKKLQGGTVVGEVAINSGGAGRKRITNTKPEEITAMIGITGRPILDWVAQTWTAGYQPKNGSIVTGDFNYKAISQIDFFNAVITDFTVPPLDGSSKDAAYFTVKIQPQTVRIQRGDGSSLKDVMGVQSQKAWLASNFRFDLDGLQDSKVASIESFTVHQPVVGDKIGINREELLKPTGGVEFPNLKLSISKASWDPWLQWYTDFLVNGNNDDQHEKNGAIVFLGPNMKDEFGRINLFNCGIYRLADDALEANSEKIARFTAELYCERMELQVPKS